MEDLVQMISLATIGFGLTFSLRILFFRKYSIPVAYLGLYVLILVGTIAEVFFPENSIPTITIGCMYWLIGPSLYLYVTLRDQHQIVFGKHCLKHLVPFVVNSSFTFVAVAMGIKPSEWLTFILYELVFFHILIYFYFSWRFISRVHNPDAPSLEVRMREAFMLLLTIVSIVIFGTSWLGTHVMMFGVFQSDNIVFRLIVQGTLTMMLFFIALLNTELSSPEKI